MASKRIRTQQEKEREYISDSGKRNSNQPEEGYKMWFLANDNREDNNKISFCKLFCFLKRLFYTKKQ
jgi:hypothetical protein